MCCWGKIRWRAHSVSAGEVVSQPVFMRSTEIWGWTGEGGWNFRNRRTLFTSFKQVLVPETWAECQEAQQLCAGNLCQRWKTHHKENYPSSWATKGDFILLPWLLTEWQVWALFHKIINWKALYAHIAWKAELFLAGKPHLGCPQQVLLHGTVPSWGAGHSTCSCWTSWVVSPSLINPPACQPASSPREWCGCSHTPSTVSEKQCPHLTLQNLIAKFTSFPPACIKIVVNPTHSEKILSSGWWLNSREYKHFFLAGERNGIGNSGILVLSEVFLNWLSNKQAHILIMQKST